jgi:hypothetical protein
VTGVDKARKFVKGIVTTIIGLFITIFFLWFFYGPSILVLPGLAVLFVGVANILHTAYTTNTGVAVRNLQAGLITTLIGLAAVLSLLWHPQFYFWLIPSTVIEIVGLMIIVRSLYGKTPTSEAEK